MMRQTVPTLTQAHSLFESLFTDTNSAIYAEPEEIKEGFYQHCLSVAFAAMVIAAKVNHLDANKAYILGLLHDYGKHVPEKNGGRFHGNQGYHDMLTMGYDDVARICLSHSFLIKDFNIRQYKYTLAEIDEARCLLAKMEYDDYDRLIQLCDMMVNDMHLINIKKRIRKISAFYGIPAKELKPFFRMALKLKQYFDTLAGCDVYELLGINRYEP